MRVKIGKDDCKGVTLGSQFQLAREVNAAPGTIKIVLFKSPRRGGWYNISNLQMLASRGGLPRPPDESTSTKGGGGVFGSGGLIPPRKGEVGHEKRFKFTEEKIVAVVV